MGLTLHRRGGREQSLICSGPFLVCSGSLYFEPFPRGPMFPCTLLPCAMHTSGPQGPPDPSPRGQEPLLCPVPGVLRASGLWALSNRALPLGSGSSGPSGVNVKSHFCRVKYRSAKPLCSLNCLLHFFSKMKVKDLSRGGNQGPVPPGLRRLRIPTSPTGCRANLLLSPGSRVAVGWEHRCLCLLFKNKGKKAFMHQSGN